MDTESFEKQIEAGDLDALRVALVNNPALADGETSAKTSPLMLACYYNRNDIALLICEFKKRLTIFEACSIGKLEETKTFLFENPALLNTFSPEGFSPIGLTCLFNHVELTSFLIKKGSDINLPSKNGFNVFPIHSAVAANSYNMTRTLLNAGAYPNVCQKAGIAPLHTAAQLGNIELIILLLEYGADVSLRMEGGKLPADLAEEKGFDEIAEILREE